VDRPVASLEPRFPGQRELNGGAPMHPAAQLRGRRGAPPSGALAVRTLVPGRRGVIDLVHGGVHAGTS